MFSEKYRFMCTKKNSKRNNNKLYRIEKDEPTIKT